MNKFIGIGRLGESPEPLTKGCKFSLAVTHWDGTINKTVWLRVFVFGSCANTCLEHLEKGRQVLVEGRVDWTKNGNSCIITDNVTFL